MPTLYLIRGVPGSGKSTFAKELWEAGVVDEVVEADNYFMYGDQYIFNPSKLGEAHAQCKSLTMGYLYLGKSVAVSNTSTTEKEVEVYREIAKELGAKFVSLVVENRHNGKMFMAFLKINWNRCVTVLV